MISLGVVSGLDALAPRARAQSTLGLRRCSTDGESAPMAASTEYSPTRQRYSRRGQLVPPVGGGQCSFHRRPSTLPRCFRQDSTASALWAALTGVSSSSSIVLMTGGALDAGRGGGQASGRYADEGSPRLGTKYQR